MTTLWRIATALFLIAGSTGALLRFGYLYDLPFGLQAANVRHAHSHLMYFGWATPAIMAMIASRLSAGEAGARGGRGAAIAAIALTLGASVYLPFLLAGYGPLAIFGADLPLGSILSGINIFAWYTFAAWYLRARRRGRSRTRLGALRSWDAAVVLLCLSSAGAWGRLVLEILDAGAPAIADLAVYFFLGVFSDGWLLFGVLGLALWGGERGIAQAGVCDVVVWAACLGVALSAPGPMAGHFGNAWRLTVGSGQVVVACGLAFHVWRSRREAALFARPEWFPVLGFLGLKLVMQVGMALPTVAAWGEQMNLRIFYLHVLTLGVVATGLMAGARETWGKGEGPSPWLFGGAVLALLGGVLAVTGLWPFLSSARERLAIAAWTSLAPLVVVLAKNTAWLLHRRHSADHTTARERSL